MMEAKDTVMGDRQILDFYYRNRKKDISEKALLQAQAEISFKAGIREVVEWTAREFGVDWSEEKEQLKEWGIKECQR